MTRALLALNLVLDAKISSDALGCRRASVILGQIGPIIAGSPCKDGKFGAIPARPSALYSSMTLVWFFADDVSARVVAKALNGR